MTFVLYFRSRAYSAKMQPAVHILIYGLLGVYTVLLGTAPLYVSSYSGIICMCGIVPSTLGHLVFRGYLYSLPELRQTIITKLLIMLSYSNNVYMIYAPLKYSLKHFIGRRIVGFLEDNYGLLCPIVSIKFLTRTPFIVSLTYLYIAKILLDINPLKFNDLDHDYWSLFCWTSLAFINLVDFTVQFTICDYNGSTAVCKWLSLDVMQDYNFESSIGEPMCPWWGIMPNIFILPLFLCVLYSFLRCRKIKLIYKSCMSTIPWCVTKTASASYSDITALPMQVADSDKLSDGTANVETSGSLSSGSEISAQTLVSEVEITKVQTSIFHDECLKNLEIKANSTITTLLDCPLINKEANFFNGKEQNSIIEFSLSEELIEKCNVQDFQLNKFKETKNEIIVHPTALVSSIPVPKRRGSAEIKFERTRWKQSGVGLLQSMSGYATFGVSCIINTLWFLLQHNEDNVAREVLFRVTFLLFLWLNWTIILAGTILYSP